MNPGLAVCRTPTCLLFPLSRGTQVPGAQWGLPTPLNLHPCPTQQHPARGDLPPPPACDSSEGVIHFILFSAPPPSKSGAHTCVWQRSVLRLQFCGNLGRSCLGEAWTSGQGHRARPAQGGDTSRRPCKHTCEWGWWKDEMLECAGKARPRSPLDKPAASPLCARHPPPPGHSDTASSNDSSACW